MMHPAGAVSPVLAPSRQRRLSPNSGIRTRKKQNLATANGARIVNLGPPPPPGHHDRADQARPGQDQDQDQDTRARERNETKQSRVNYLT